MRNCDQIDQQSSASPIYGGLKFVAQYLLVCLHLANISVLLFNRCSFSPFKIDIFSARHRLHFFAPLLYARARFRINH